MLAQGLPCAAANNTTCILIMNGQLQEVMLMTHALMHAWGRRDQLGDRHQAAEAALAVQVQLQERLHQDLKEAGAQAEALQVDDHTPTHPNGTMCCFCA
jgi:hypothetical protein